MSRERPFPNPTDGLVHQQSLVEGDLYFTLYKLPGMAKVDNNILRVINSIAHQDYGSTASTVLTHVEEKDVNTPKHVHMIQFIAKWNAANEQFGAMLMKNLAGRDGAPVATEQVVQLLKNQTPAGEEPWMYNQLKTFEETLATVEYGGLVGNTRGMEKKVQTVFPSAYWVENTLKLKNVHWLEEQRLNGATLNMYHLYAVCYEAVHVTYDKFPLGTRFQLFGSSQCTVAGVMPRVAEHLQVEGRPRQKMACVHLAALSPNTAGIPFPFQDWTSGEAAYWRLRFGPPQDRRRRQQQQRQRLGTLKRFADHDYGYLSSRKVLRYIEGRPV